MLKKMHLLLWCFAVGIFAFICLDFWTLRNAPLYRRLEHQWHEDVARLEASHKLPAAWFDVKEIEVIGGTPESKDWLKRMQIPLKAKPTGQHKLEVLVVVWEEDGKRGTLVQYDLVDLKTQNNIWELGRTFILSRPNNNGFKAILEDLR